MSEIRCIVGLGNPGKGYEITRHNAGFMAVDYVVSELRVRFVPGRGEFYYATYNDTSGRSLFFLKPTTFMNASGRVVFDFAQMNGLKPEEFLVILDDFSIELGRIRIRKKGSDGGHKGLASIIYMFNTDEIPRLRIGIGPLPQNTDPVEFVLSPFSQKELKELENVLSLVYEAFTDIIYKGITYAMNKFNRTKKGVEYE